MHDSDIRKNLNSKNSFAYSSSSHHRNYPHSTTASDPEIFDGWHVRESCGVLSPPSVNSGSRWTRRSSNLNQRTTLQQYETEGILPPSSTIPAIRVSPKLTILEYTDSDASKPLFHTQRCHTRLAELPRDIEKDTLEMPAREDPKRKC